jgi:CBS domain-containing protein
LEDVAKAIEDGKSADTTAGQLVNYSETIERLREHEDLGSALSGAGKSARQIAVVDDSGRLVGVLDLDSVMARRKFPETIADDTAMPVGSFDAIT